MANQLTGEFDAVVQIAARQLNGLLATLHVNGKQSNAPLQTTHSTRLRIGDPRRPRPELGDFGDWVFELQQQSPRPIGVADLQGQLVSTAPPGAAGALATAFEALLDGGVFETVPDVFRGTADVQVSSVRVSAPAASTSEITIHADVRAHYRPDTGTTDLPSPIHGEVRATFDIRVQPSPSGRKLSIRPSADDNKIQFIPAAGSGTDQVEASRLGAELRKVLRDSVKMPPVALPDGFKFEAFKGVGSGTSHALAIPLQLSDTPVPANAIHGITQSVVGPSGFAFAVGEDFVKGMIDIEAIKREIKKQRIRIRMEGPFGISTTVVYKLRFTSGPTLTFRANAIDISGSIAVETDTWWAPNGSVSFTQPIGLFLENTTQVVTLEAIGAPDVDTSTFIPQGRAETAVKQEMEKALEENGPGVSKVLEDARADLRNGLRAFDTSATPRYASIQITADGIIVRGDIGTAPRPVPVVDVRETVDGTGFTALHSWVPGGRIDRFIWTWVEYPGHLQSVTSGVSRTVVDEHQFVLPKPAGITTRSSICLRIEGSLLSAGGIPIPISGGTTCLVPYSGTVLEVPAWFEPVTVPVWRPDLADHARARDGLAGHVSVQSIGAGASGPGQNALIYFADWKSSSPLAALGESLKAYARHSMGMIVIIVVPPGTFDERRRELDAKLSAIGEPFASQTHVTEDDDGGWTRTFEPRRVPATFLVNARRQFVWKEDGTPDARELPALLLRAFPAAAPRRHTPLRLRVAPGERALDASFEDDRGEENALHRMRGRRMVLVFWQAWSAPSLAELQNVEATADELRRNDTYIVGFHGGRQDAFDRIRRELKVSFPLVQDDGQRIATSFGVRCWPTTVTVDAEGQVESVQFGRRALARC